jgi:hypothetical protein
LTNTEIIHTFAARKRGNENAGITLKKGFKNFEIKFGKRRRNDTFATRKREAGKIEKRG